MFKNIFVDMFNIRNLQNKCSKGFWAPEGSSRFIVPLGWTCQSDSHKHEGPGSSAGGGSSQSCWCIRWTVIHTSCFVLTPSSPPLPSSIWHGRRLPTSSILTRLRPHWRMEGGTASSIHAQKKPIKLSATRWRRRTIQLGFR